MEWDGDDGGQGYLSYLVDVVVYIPKINLYFAFAFCITMVKEENC